MRCFSGLRFVFLRKTVAILLRHSAAAKSFFGIAMENNHGFAPASFCSQMRFRVCVRYARDKLHFFWGIGLQPCPLSGCRRAFQETNHNHGKPSTAQSAGKCWGSVVTHFRENQSHFKKNVFLDVILSSLLRILVWMMESLAAAKCWSKIAIGS